MAYIALVPKRDVFKRHHRVTANHARESTQSLARYRVAFVRHGRAPFLAFAKIFLHFENFSPLKMTKFCCPAIDTGSDHGQRRHKFGVAVALHDLRRKCCWLLSQLFTHCAFNFWIDMCVRAYVDTDFPYATVLERLFYSVYSSP